MITCVYFGVRTPKRESTVQCKNCKKFAIDEFKRCTKESNILMATSIVVDEKGHTVEIPPVGLASDTVLAAENFTTVTKESIEEKNE